MIYSEIQHGFNFYSCMRNLFSEADSQPKERAEKGSVAAQSKPSYLRASSWRVKSFTHTSSQSPTDPYLKWDAVYHHDNRSSKFVVYPSSDTLDVAEGSEAKSTSTADNGPNYQE